MYVASDGIKTAVILNDPTPLHPREDQDNLGTMVCWHRRHSLGDPHHYDDPHSFASSLAEKYLSREDLFHAIKNGEVRDLRFVPGESTNAPYTVEYMWAIPPKEDRWMELNFKVSKDMELLESDGHSFDLDEDLLSCCNTQELLQICEKYGDVAILPVFLYDHSVLALSTQSFIGRAHHAEWDSGQIGFIYLDKETAIKEMLMPTEQVRLSQPISALPQVLPVQPGQQIVDVMKSNGYTPVREEDILNPDASILSSSGNQLILDSSPLKEGLLYKKDSRIYRIDGLTPDNTLSICAVASFNPGYTPLTEETWKSRAIQCLEAEIKEYNSYLQNEVYGYQMYEGLDEIDSCWGFNACGEDIRKWFDDMFGDWGNELKEDMMNASYDYNEDFDIDDFFETNDFPAFRQKLSDVVRDYIKSEASDAPIYPFATPADDLLANKESMLDMIVDELYKEHKEPDLHTIHKAISSHAGISRDLQPKITAADLDVDKAYTAAELVALVEEKGSLHSMISHAQAQQAALSGRMNKMQSPDMNR